MEVVMWAMGRMTLDGRDSHFERGKPMVMCFFFCLVRDVKMESGRQRHPSGGVSAKEMVIGLEGVELGADGKVRRAS